jgi:predicted RNA-binding Zn ribbon-like protein
LTGVVGYLLLSPAYDIPKTAPPGSLRLVQQFVNSVDLENRVEWLDERWFAERGLCGDEDLAAARDAREAVRALLRANNDEPLELSAIATLNEISADFCLALRFDDLGRVVLEPPGQRPLGAVLAAVYAAMMDGSWSRLKSCRHCRWAFYDYSRNRSATWCSMRLCGNRSKTRAYRKRGGGRAAR